MPVPASQVRLEKGLEIAMHLANATRRRVVQVRDASAAGPVRRSALIQLLRELSDAIAEWESISALPGIREYAREQYADAGLDIVAEWQAMTTEATDLRDWIHTTFPKDLTSGAWLTHSYSLTGLQTELTFGVTAMAEFRTRADAFVATIG